MEISIRRKLFLFSFIVLAVIGVLGYAVHKSNQQLLVSGQWIQHTQQVISQSDKIYATAKDIETSSSGFVITQDSTFLAPLYSADKIAFTYTEQLRQLTGDNQVQQRKIDSLEFYLHKLVNFLLKAVKLRSEEGLATTITYISGKESKYYTDQVRQIINDIQREENVLMKQRKKANDANLVMLHRFSLMVYILIALFTVLLLGITGKYLFQNKEKKKRAAELVIAKEELSFQNDEKGKRAAELLIANKELLYQNKEKGKRAAELLIANKELLYQNEEKENRASELVIANEALGFQMQEKEKAEQQREFEKNNLDALINNTEDLMWSVDKDFNMITSNKPFDDLMELITGKEVDKGSNILEAAFSGGQWRKYRKLYKRAFAGESFTEVVYNELPVEAWSEISYCPIRKGDDVMGTAGHSRDITERKLAEEALLLIQFAIDNTGDAVFWMTPDAHIFKVNEAASLMLGYSQQEMLELSVPDIDPDYNAQKWLIHYEDLRRKGSLFFETIQKAKDGRLIPVEIRANYIKFGDEEFNCAFSRDISERKMAEETLKQSEMRLKDAQAIAHIGNFEVDLKDHSEIWSDEMYEIYGITKGEAIPSKELFLSFIHPDDRGYVATEMEECLRTYESSTTNFRFIRKDGIMRYGYSEARFELDKNKKLVRIYGILQDVTGNKLAEIERTKMVSDMVIRNMELEQFGYIISHNLRAPVANIIGASNALKDPELSIGDKEILNKGISESVVKLDAVVQDLNYILEVKGEIDETKEIVCFSELVEDIKASINNLIDKENIEIKCDFSEIDEFLTLRPYLYSVFYNLISNSIKYRRPQVHTIIEIKSCIVNNKIELFFTDNGMGIDIKKNGDKLFGLYKRFHTNIEGKGMGLFMVKTQVEMLGGKISIKSLENEGAEFKIEFEI